LVFLLLDEPFTRAEHSHRMAKAAKRSRGRPRKRETKFSRWIDASGMTRDEVADALDINRTHVDKLCRGAGRPGLALALAIEKLTRGAITAGEWVDARVERY
jgi:hypothetical protein